mmetsp:Transcript_27365/g.66546  ORF Transcript_27365/g.66546 Transcript_27365/m.66546 type:complete len:1034 (-) Transcript_27365:180-3281(-)
MVDVHKNLLFKRLEAKFPGLQEKLFLGQDWMLCLPRSDILQHCTLDENFVSQHILHPCSKPEGDTKTDSDVPKFQNLNNCRVEVNDKFVRVFTPHGKVSCKLLYTETYYDEDFRSFLVLHTDTSLDSNGSIGSPNNAEGGKKKSGLKNENEEKGSGKRRRSSNQDGSSSSGAAKTQKEISMPPIERRIKKEHEWCLKVILGRAWKGAESFLREFATQFSQGMTESKSLEMKDVTQAIRNAVEHVLKQCPSTSSITKDPEETRNVIEASIQGFLLQSIYPVIVANRNKIAGHKVSNEAVDGILESVRSLDMDTLKIRKCIQCDPNAAISILKEMENVYTPASKLACIQDAFWMLTHCIDFEYESKATENKFEELKFLKKPFGIIVAQTPESKRTPRPGPIRCTRRRSVESMRRVYFRRFHGQQLCPIMRSLKEEVYAAAIDPQCKHIKPKPGWRLILVNGKSVRGLKQEELISVCKASTLPAVLTFQRIKTEDFQLEQQKDKAGESNTNDKDKNEALEGNSAEASKVGEIADLGKRDAREESGDQSAGQSIPRDIVMKNKSKFTVGNPNAILGSNKKSSPSGPNPVALVLNLTSKPGFKQDGSSKSEDNPTPKSDEEVGSDDQAKKRGPTPPPPSFAPPIPVVKGTPETSKINDSIISSSIISTSPLRESPPFERTTEVGVTRNENTDGDYRLHIDVSLTERTRRTGSVATAASEEAFAHSGQKPILTADDQLLYFVYLLAHAHPAQLYTDVQFILNLPPSFPQTDPPLEHTATSLHAALELILSGRLPTPSQQKLLNFLLSTPTDPTDVDSIGEEQEDPEAETVGKKLSECLNDGNDEYIPTLKISDATSAVNSEASHLSSPDAQDIGLLRRRLPEKKKSTKRSPQTEVSRVENKRIGSVGATDRRKRDPFSKEGFKSRGSVLLSSVPIGKGVAVNGSTLRRHSVHSISATQLSLTSTEFDPLGSKARLERLRNRRAVARKRAEHRTNSQGRATNEGIKGIKNTEPILKNGRTDAVMNSPLSDDILAKATRRE